MPAEKVKRERTPLWIRWLAAFAAVAIALGLSFLLRDAIEQTIFIFFFAAIAFTSWYSGFWAALFVVVSGVLLVNYFFMQPYNEFDFHDPGLIFTMSIFSAVALFYSWLADQMRLARASADIRAEQMGEQAVELEAQLHENQTLTEELETALTSAEDAQRLAEKANRAKSDFLAVMSHELRTPLNAIIGYTDLLSSEVGGKLSDAQKLHLERVRASSWHLLDLIQDVLSFSRIEAGRETLRVSDVDTGKLAEDAVAYVQRQAVDKGLDVQVELPPERITIITDPAKLRQILLNLLSNAVKFTDQGTVGLRLKRNAEGVEFEVWDTGRGIDPVHHALIFEPFTQVDQSSTREKGGAGLGLPVSLKLAHLLGGGLAVESLDGRGAVFRLHLPLRLRV